MTNARFTIAISACILVAFLLFNSIYMLDQRQYALVLQFGQSVAQHSTPGLKIKLPFIQHEMFFEKRIQNLYAATSEVIASDQKTMRVDAFAKYRIIDPLKFYQSAQSEVKFKARLSTILDSSLRQVLGSAPFQDLLGEQRVELMQKIRQIVDEGSRHFGVEVVDVRILRAELPENSRNAVYSRMRTEREKEAREIRAKGAEEAAIILAGAEKSKTIIIAKAEQKAQIIRGEGEAQAAQIFNSVASLDPEFFDFYMSMKSYRQIINPQNSSIILGSDSKLLANLYGKK